MIPKLNDKPLYDIVIPSTGETHRFRPYLVKEEKILLMAFESEDRKTIMKAIVDTIQACMPEIDILNLTVYDIEYLFTKIRGKSVGESVDLKIKCKHCESQNEVEVNIDDLDTSTFERSKKIAITNDVSVLMCHPSYEDVLQDPELSSIDTKQPQRLIRSVVKSIQKIYTADTVINAKEESEEDMVEFVESLDQHQFKSLLGFLLDSPRISFDASFDCEHCGKHNEMIIQDQKTFF